MKNRYKPFFYDEKKPPFLKVLLIFIAAVSGLIFIGFQIPSVRQIIAEPVYAAGSLSLSTLRELFEKTRMYREPESPRQVYEPLELPDSQVLFAEDLQSLSAVTQEDPLADLRLTPTPSEFSRVAEWQYLDPNLNYEISSGGKPLSETTVIHLIPPVFERADLFNDGPAILSADLRFWGIIANQYEIAAQIHPDSLDPSVSLGELKSYTESRYPEYSAMIRLNGDKDTLTGLLQAEIPVILPVRARSPYSFWPNDDRIILRYFLILGYDSINDIFSYQDTLNGNTLEISAADLMAAWYPFQRTWLVIYPTEKDSSVRDALAENYFEELNLQQAEAKFRVDSENLPQNPFAQYNYAVVLHRTGDDGGAWERFQMAVELTLPQRYFNYQTDILETARNLGYADDIDALIDPVLTRNGHDEILLLYRGWAMILRGELKAGAGQFDRAEKINPNHESVLYALKYKETMMQY